MKLSVYFWKTLGEWLSKSLQLTLRLDSDELVVLILRCRSLCAQVGDGPQKEKAWKGKWAG